MRAISLTWARKAGPALMVGLFLAASTAEAAPAQPRRGQPRAPMGPAAARRAKTPRVLPPGSRRTRRGGQPTVANPRRRAPGAMRRGRPGARRPGARRVRKEAPAAQAMGKPVTQMKRAKAPSQTEAQRLAKLKKANKDQRLVGAVKRRLKPKASWMNQILFYILFSLIICFSLVTITRKSPLMAALSLLVVFLGLAGVYLFLQAPFMAAIQLIVYAGAVVVLFVFVIMSIGFDEERSAGDLGKEILYFSMAFLLTGAGAFVFHNGSGFLYIAGFAAMELLALGFVVLGKLRYPVTRFLGIAAVTFALAQVVRLIQLSPVLIGKTVGLKTAFDAPNQAYATPADGSFGNARAIGQSVFTDNVFAFEALSLLLLAAVVAAVVIARSRKDSEEQTS